MKVMQKEEASKLEKMQLEMEEKTQASLYADNQSTYSIAPNNPNQQNFVIVPGAPVQPSYPDINPYAGHHNTNIVPVVYNPSDYGVTYDQPQIFVGPPPAVTPSPPQYYYPANAYNQTNTLNHTNSVFMSPMVHNPSVGPDKSLYQI